MFKQIADVQGMMTGLNTIRTSEAAVRDSLNEWGPQIIEGVLGGDNIAQVNSLISCFTGVRRTRLIRVVKRMLPYQFDEEAGEFTQKHDSQPKVVRAEKAFVAFMESGETLFNAINEEKAKEQAEKTDEEKAAAALRALTKALEACAKCGVSYAEVQKASITSGYAIEEVFAQLRQVA